LLGIPEADQEKVRREADDRIRTDPGTPRDYTATPPTGESFADYIDWRRDHPSDDLMTELLNAEFEEERGRTRALTKGEIPVFFNPLAAAGNETTNRLIGWTGKLLSDHPDQRRELASNYPLAPNTVEEVLRYEPPGLQIARYVTSAVEYYGE